MWEKETSSQISKQHTIISKYKTFVIIDEPAKEII